MRQREREREREQAREKRKEKRREERERCILGLGVGFGWVFEKTFVVHWNSDQLVARHCMCVRGMNAFGSGMEIGGAY